MKTEKRNLLSFYAQKIVTLFGLPTDEEDVRECYFDSLHDPVDICDILQNLFQTSFSFGYNPLPILRKMDGHIQWRYVSNVSDSNLARLLIENDVIWPVDALDSNESDEFVIARQIYDRNRVPLRWFGYRDPDFTKGQESFFGMYSEELSSLLRTASESCFKGT